MKTTRQYDTWMSRFGIGCAVCTALICGPGLLQAQEPGGDTNWHGQPQDAEPGELAEDSKQDSPGAPSGDQAGNQEQDDGDWILVTYDLDGDGRFDGYEYIFHTDFEAARRISSMRQEARQRSDARQSAVGREFRIEGVITDLKTIRIVGPESDHQAAKINTDRGKVTVDLGPLSNLAMLGLSEGDQISVTGGEGRINGKRILVASRVEADGKTVDVERAELSERLGSVKGEVISTRNATSGNSSEIHQLASIRTEQGALVTVDLGPQSALQSIDVNKGDQLNVLGRPGSLEGEQVILAQRFALNGDVHRVQSGSSSEGTPGSSAGAPGSSAGAAGTESPGPTGVK